MKKRHELIHNKYRDILLKEVVSNNKKIQVSYDLIIQELQEVQQYLPDDVRAEFNTKIISLIMCVGIMGFIKSHMICKEIMSEISRGELEPEEGLVKAFYKILEFAAIDKEVVKRIEDDLITKMREFGFSIREIARIVGKSKSTVHEQINKLGVVPDGH